MTVTCCCDGCDIALDTFSTTNDPPLNWLEVAGSDWATDSTSLTTSTSNALLIYDLDHPDGDAPCIVSIKYTGSAGDEWDLVIGYVDSSNYTFARITVGNGGGGGDDNTACISVYNKVAGVDTLLGRASMYLGSAVTVSLVYTADHLIALFPSSSVGTKQLQFEMPPIAGHRVGVGTGTIAGTASFDNFAWRRIQYDGNNTTCVEYPLACAWFIEGNGQDSQVSCGFDYTGAWSQGHYGAFRALKTTATNALARATFSSPDTTETDAIISANVFLDSGANTYRIYYNDDIYLEVETFSGALDADLSLYDSTGLVATVSTLNGGSGSATVTLHYTGGVMRCLVASTYLVSAITPPAAGDIRPAFGTGGTCTGVGFWATSATCYSAPAQICGKYNVGTEPAESQEITISGVTNLTCTGSFCTDLNATYTLRQYGVGSSCDYYFEDSLGPTEKCGILTTYFIALSAESSGGGVRWHLVIHLGGQVIYNKATAVVASLDPAAVLTQADFTTLVLAPAGICSTAINFTITPQDV